MPALRPEPADPFAEQLRLSRVHTRLVPMRRSGVGYSIEPATEGWFELPPDRGFAGYGLGRALCLLLDAMRGLSALHQTATANGEPFAHGEFAPLQLRVDPIGVCRLVPLTARHYVSEDVAPPQSTLGFLSPERLIADKVGVRADVFSAGVLLWEALAGRRLTEGRSREAIVERLLSRKLRVPPLPPQLSWATPLKVEVERALSVNQQRRFADCEEFSTVILHLAQDHVATHADVAAFFTAMHQPPRSAPASFPSTSPRSSPPSFAPSSPTTYPPSFPPSSLPSSPPTYPPSSAPVSRERLASSEDPTLRMRSPSSEHSASTFGVAGSGDPRHATLKMNVTLKMAQVPAPKMNVTLKMAQVPAPKMNVTLKMAQVPAPIAADDQAATPVAEAVTTAPRVTPTTIEATPRSTRPPSPPPFARAISLPPPPRRATPASLPQASPASLPQASPASLPQASPASLPQASPASLPQASPASLPQASPASLPQVSPASLPQASPASLPRATPPSLPQANSASSTRRQTPTTLPSIQTAPPPLRRPRSIPPPLPPIATQAPAPLSSEPHPPASAPPQASTQPVVKDLPVESGPTSDPNQDASSPEPTPVVAARPNPWTTLRRKLVASLLIGATVSLGIAASRGAGSAAAPAPQPSVRTAAATVVPSSTPSAPLCCSEVSGLETRHEVSNVATEQPAAPATPAAAAIVKTERSARPRAPSARPASSTTPQPRRDYGI